MTTDPVRGPEETAEARDGQPSAGAQALTRLLAPGTRVLDFGCGYGDDVIALRDAGYDAYGYDPYHMPWDDPSPLAAPSGQTWPCVLCAYVLSVLRPDARTAAFAELLALVAPDGLALVVERERSDVLREATKWLWTPLDDGWVHNQRHTFVTGFTSTHLLDAARELGLTGWTASPRLAVCVLHRPDAHYAPLCKTDDFFGSPTRGNLTN